MASLLPTVAILFLLAITSPASAQLVAVQSGLDGRVGPTLRDGMVFCPSEFSKKGFSIKCETDSDTSAVKFVVNNQLIFTDAERPFHIRGSNARGQVRPWTDYPMDVPTLIVCKVNNDNKYSARVTFSCQSDSQSPVQTPPPMVMETPAPLQTLEAMPMMIPTITPSPGMAMKKMPADMYFVEAGRGGQVGPKVYNAIEFCPSVFPSGTYSILCVESDASAFATFYINGVERRRETVVPYFISGDFDGDIVPLMNVPSEFEVKCTLSDGKTNAARVKIACKPSGDNMPPSAAPRPTQPPRPSAPKPTQPSGPAASTGSDVCVVLDARKVMLTADWTRTEDGIGYKIDDPSESIDSPGKPLIYKFTAPVSSQFAFVLDMTTRHTTEHNDVWAKFPAGGWTRTKNGKTRGGPQLKFMKVYQNTNGRATIATTIDFDAHSIATARKLVKGREYVVLLAGRSTMLTVHRIIMFPCSGQYCQRTDRTWKSHLSTCAAL